MLGRVVGKGSEVDDSGVRARRGRLDRVVERLARRIQESGTDRGCGLGELRELGVDEVALERRHDDHVDQHQSSRHDDRQPQPEAGADTAERVHGSRNR